MNLLIEYFVWMLNSWQNLRAHKKKVKIISEIVYRRSVKCIAKKKFLLSKYPHAR